MASDYLLEIEGIKGESKDTKHPGTIEIMSFSWGVSNAGSFASSTGGSSGKASFASFTFTKRVDKASPLLFQACSSGKHIPKAELFIRKAGKPQLEYLKCTFTDCLVESIQGQSADPRLSTDEVTFTFQKVEMDYRRTSSSGLVGPVTSGQFVLLPEIP